MNAARKSLRCLLMSLCLLVLTACQGRPSEAHDDRSDADQSERGMITFARWMKESSLEPTSYDAVAFIMDGTCHGCQVTFDRMLTKASRRILVVSCDPATVSRYNQAGVNVHYDSTCRMQCIDSLTTQTTVFFTSAESGLPTVVALDPGTVGQVVSRLR